MKDQTATPAKRKPYDSDLTDAQWSVLALRAEVRRADGRNTEPSAAIIDSQSVKTTESGGIAGMTRAKR